MKKIISTVGISAALLLPLLADAQSTGQGLSTLQYLISQVRQIVQSLIPLAFGLAILGFFWGLVKYIFAAGSEEGASNGKSIMLWALVALFVMSSVWGIIQLAQNTFGVNNVGVTVPSINIPAN